MQAKHKPAADRALRAAVEAIESLGTHPLLTTAAAMLAAAQALVTAWAAEDQQAPAAIPPAAPAPRQEDDPIIWRTDLQRTLGRSSETVRLWMRSGKLPAPDARVSARTMGWRQSTLRAAGIML